MATGATYRVRPQPCTHCGEKVMIIETGQVGFGGLWKLTPVIRVEHADFVPGSAPFDRVDDECQRPRVSR